MADLNRRDINVLLCAILTTLNECDFEGCPESSLYLLVDSDIEKWQQLRTILVNGKLVDIRNHFVSLTAKGCEMAQRITETINANKQGT